MTEEKTFRLKIAFPFCGENSEEKKRNIVTKYTRVEAFVISTKTLLTTQAKRTSYM